MNSSASPGTRTYGSRHGRAHADATPLPTSVLPACPNYARSKFIHDLAEQLSAARYLGQSIEIGGHSLVIKAGAHGSNKLYLGDRVVSDYAYRIEPSCTIQIFVDALVFVVNAGGAAYICSNFPVYIVAVRSGGPPEITRVPSMYARRRDEACVDPHRTATGLKFTARPQADSDGWSQEWTPEGGLTPPTIIPFAPRPGTTMKNDGGGVLIGNEQFFRTLQRLATESGQSPATLVEAFAQVSAENKVLVDKLPDHLSMFSGCSTPGLPWTCRSDTEPAHARGPLEG